MYKVKSKDYLNKNKILNHIEIPKEKKAHVKKFVVMK